MKNKYIFHCFDTIGTIYVCLTILWVGGVADISFYDYWFSGVLAVSIYYVAYLIKYLQIYRRYYRRRK